MRDLPIRICTRSYIAVYKLQKHRLSVLGGYKLSCQRTLRHKKVVDGMDVCTHGDPPHRFKVLGSIEDERPGGMIITAQSRHDIVQKARQNRSNAVIFVSSALQLAGYYTASGANSYSYGNSATAFRSSNKRATRQTYFNVRSYSISRFK